MVCMYYLTIESPYHQSLASAGVTKPFIHIWVNKIEAPAYALVQNWYKRNGAKFLLIQFRSFGTWTGIPAGNYTLPGLELNKGDGHLGHVL